MCACGCVSVCAYQCAIVHVSACAPVCIQMYMSACVGKSGEGPGATACTGAASVWEQLVLTLLLPLQSWHLVRGMVSGHQVHPQELESHV